MSNKGEILVSIIIPVYQAKDTLKTCVLSCLNQKFVKPQEMEVIIIIVIVMLKKNVIKKVFGVNIIIM